MSNLENMEELMMISHYAAPDTGIVRPYYIEKNTELIEILTGGMVFFNDREYRKGTIFWHINGDHTIHRTSADEPYRCMVFRFRMKENSKRLSPRVSTWNVLSEMDSFFSQSLRFYHAGHYDSKALSQYIYTRLYWEAVQQIETTGAGLTFPPPLQRAITFIGKQFQHEISVEATARYARVSKPHLFTLFKEHLKTSPHKYINNSRMNHARSLLAGSDMSIKEIAHECGYSSIASFYRIFHQQHKLSPALYREKNNPYQQLPG